MTTNPEGVVTAFNAVTETGGPGAVNEGSDALSGIEVLEFNGATLDLNDAVQLFDASNALIGTFDTIQAAVNAAHASGDTIRIKAGSYTEDVTITGKSITIDGVETAGANDVTLHGQITVAGALNGAFSITDLNIDATGKAYGVYVTANSTGFAGSVTLDDVAISNAQQNGFAYIRAGNGSTPTLGDTIGAISILNSVFSNNATVNTGSGGRGDILLFGYNQDLTVTNVTIGSPGAFAQKAIQMRGIEDGADVIGAGPYDPAGDVSLTNLTVTGSYAQDLIAFYRIADFDLFAMSGVHLQASAPWGLFNFDEVGGVIDLSTGLTLTTTNLSGGPIAAEQGLATLDTFTGTSGNDVLRGRGGNDVLNGGAGDDVVVYAVGDGQDTVNGGTEGAVGDLLVVSNVGGAQATITVAAAGADPVTVDLSTTAGTEITASEIEDITINLGANGDTVVVNGNLGGTSLDVNTITVNGGAGNDTVDATSLSSNHRVVFNGNGGDDTFESSNAGGNDTFSGGSAGANGDTVDYSAVTVGGVNVNLASGTATDIGGTGVGSDTLIDVENVIGTGQADSITGDGDANVLTGGGGGDVLEGAGGDDTLHGDGGTDTAVYDDALSNYAITFNVNTGAATVDETGAPGAVDEGTDTLDGVETLDFSNTDIDLAAGVLVFSSFDEITGIGTLKSTHAGIQAGINAADADDVIFIRNGTYVGQFTIGAALDGLTLIGESEAGVIIRAPSSGLIQTADDAVTGRDLFSVITVTGADNVTIKNLTVNGDEQAGQVIGGGDFNGIAYVNASGTVEDVTIDEIRDPLTGVDQVSGVQRGNALHVSNTLGSPKSFDLIDSTLTGFQKTGAVIRNANVNLMANLVATFGVQHVMAQNGIQLSHGVTGDVTGNDISGFGYDGGTGVVVVGLLVFNATGLNVSGNEYTGTATDDVGMYFIDSNGNTIADNDIGTADYGIIDYGVIATQNTVTNTGVNANTYTAIDLVNHYLELDPASQTTVLTPVGSEGVDNYLGGAGADTLDGRGGNDYLEGKGGADTILGGAGDDTIVWTAGDGNDALIDGGANNDTLELRDTAGNDTIAVVTDGTTIVGLGGGTSNVTDVETATLDATGGGSTDTLDYTGTTANIAVNLGANTATGFAGVYSGSIENVTGGSGNDDLTGSSESNTIIGGAGNDDIGGGLGNDTLTGGADSDTFAYTLGDGVDTVQGELGLRPDQCRSGRHRRAQRQCDGR